MPGGFSHQHFLAFHHFPFLNKYPSEIVGVSCRPARVFNFPPPELQGAQGWSLPPTLPRTACQEGEAKRDLSYGNCRWELLGTHVTTRHGAWAGQWG